MKFLRRIGALFIIFLATVGLLFSLFGIVKIWQWRMPLTQNLTKVLNVTDGLLITAGDGLTVVDNVLDNATSSLATLDRTTTAIVKSMEDTTNLAKSFSTFFKTDMITTIKNTQLSVIAAQSSARVIDNLLYGLSNIPFLGINYKPPVPLNKSLSGVATSMNDLPDSFEEISTNLDSSGENLFTLQTQIALISESLNDIQENLGEARAVVQEYNKNIRNMQEWSQKIRAKLTSGILILTIIMTLFLISIAVAQLGALTMAFDTLKWKEPANSPLVPPSQTETEDLSNS
jgi:methyl-accepting chemotaxis protein